MERRDKTGIRADLLKEAEEAAGKSRLVYRVNMNFYTIRGFLAELIGAGLLSQIGKQYKTTEKGLKYLETIKEQRNLLEVNTCKN